MVWFKIIKVEDIDFDGAIQAFGQYTEEGNFDPALLLMEMIMGGKPNLDNYLKKKIRINHKESYRYLKNKLGKEPTEKQITDFIIRTIMHEGTHAAMGREQDNMSVPQKEYGAFTGQFPESTYLRIKNFLTHPEARKRLGNMPITGIKQLDDLLTAYSPNFERLENLITWVDAMVTGVPEPKRSEYAEKLIRMELTARKKGDRREVWEMPFSVENLIQRYGKEEIPFFKELSRYNTSNTQKMAGAVTTASAPAMFNKVVRGKKKRRDADARR